MENTQRILILGFASLFLFSCTAHAANLVEDAAGLFTEAEKEYISAYHAKLQEVYDIDYRVITLDQEADIETASIKKFKEINVGSESKSGRGLLLTIVPKQNELRLEVSTALEGVYTDAFVSYIEHRQMIPFFQSGKVASGVLATTELIFARAQEGTAGQAFLPPMEANAAGGGATNRAGLGDGEAQRQGPDVIMAADPRSVLNAYLGALESRNTNPELSIYSSGTREMFKKWTVTPAQQDMEAKSIKACGKGTLAMTATHAVIRRPLDQRQCPPYFFLFEDGAWRLDFNILQAAVRFNHLNEWRFDFASQDPARASCVCHYMFAFDDVVFNKNGYPWPGSKLRWNLSFMLYKGFGTMVTRVGAGSAGEAAGFEVGDLVLEWNGIKNPDHLQIVKNMDTQNPGYKFNVILQRKEQKITLNLTAPPFPE